MNRAGFLYRPREKWSESEAKEMRKKYQACYDELQKLLDEAKQQDKMTMTEEHVPFLMLSKIFKA